MERLPIETQTLYTELVERLTAFEALRSLGRTPGTFTRKRIKGREYVYFQYMLPDGAKRQAYIGPESPDLEDVISRFSAARGLAEQDRASLDRLAAQVRAGGAMLVDAPTARVIRALSDAGVFALGGVLVGTQAFIAIGNLLGWRWSSALRTQDIDIAVDPTIAVALPSATADVHDALARLEMGFLPVPALDHTSPTTSYMVRGRGLRVDLLTPARGPSREPLSIPRFKAAAQPIAHLGYLIREPVGAAIVDGGATLVRVPDPARFALHKMLVSESRPVTEQAKRQKDLDQSAQILQALFEDRPGDVERAWTDMQAEGRSCVKCVRTAVEKLRDLAPEVAAQLWRVFE